MRYRQLDSANDMRFGNGQQDFYRDSPEAVGQAVLTRLRLISGEWYIDTAEGTIYQGGILGKTSAQTADSIIRERILGTQGVLSIVDNTYSGTLDTTTRRYSVACTVVTVYGEQQIAVAI